jgi:hypothetical protein
MSSTTEPISVALPTPAEFETAGAEGSRWLDSVSEIEHALTRLVAYAKETEPGQPILPAGIDVDAAYIGELYGFVDYLETQADEASERHAALRELLTELHHIRLDKVARERHIQRAGS